MWGGVNDTINWNFTFDGNRFNSQRYISKYAFYYTMCVYYIRSVCCAGYIRCLLTVTSKSKWTFALNIFAPFDIRLCNRDTQRNNYFIWLCHINQCAMCTHKRKATCFSKWTKYGRYSINIVRSVFHNREIQTNIVCIVNTLYKHTMIAILTRKTLLMNHSTPQ